MTIKTLEEYKTFSTKNGVLYHGNCLNVMKHIPSNSIDMILCDLPYGTTSCSWDTIIDFTKLWKQYKRLITDTGAIVLTSTQPFTTVLIASNLEMFKYTWVWDKCKIGGFVNAKLKPLKLFEDICVFSKGKTANCNPNNMKYYPQGLRVLNKKQKSSTGQGATGYARPSTNGSFLQENTGYPTQLLTFPVPDDRFHPTQKPVALFEYLIKTYTLKGETVLDNCSGSGTTAEAAEATGRKWICIEKSDEYIAPTIKRLTKWNSTLF